jgi:glycosyltransferase involved in cell wall biosynthesis
VTGAPLVSCVIPVFNGERFLGEALGSVLGQTYPAVEVIVVDDGSSDGTRAKAQDFGDRVRYLWQVNAGPSTARNTGIAAATGGFVSFLDADDLWHPEKLARQIARFEARPELDLCVTHVQNFWMAEVEEEARRLGESRHARPLPGYSSVTLVARRSLFETIGVFDTTLKHGDDTEWFVRAERHGAVGELLPDVLVRRRLHANNRSRQWAGRSRAEYLHLMRALVGQRRATMPAGGQAGGHRSPTRVDPRSDPA